MKKKLSEYGILFSVHMTKADTLAELDKLEWEKDANVSKD